MGFANVGFYKNRKSIHMWWAFRDFFNILWDFLFSNPTIAHKFVGFFRFFVFLWDISKIFCFSDHKRGRPNTKKPKKSKKKSKKNRKKNSKKNPKEGGAGRLTPKMPKNDLERPTITKKFNFNFSLSDNEQRENSRNLLLKVK